VLQYPSNRKVSTGPIGYCQPPNVTLICSQCPGMDHVESSLDVNNGHWSQVIQNDHCQHKNLTSDANHPTWSGNWSQAITVKFTQHTQCQL